MKSAKEWVEIFIDHIGYSPEERIRAIQANCFRAAAEICQRRMTTLKNNAYNLACDECRIFLESQAEELEAKA